MSSARLAEPEAAAPPPPPRTARRRTTLLAGALALSAAAGVGAFALTRDDGDEVFAAGRAFREPIAADPVLDPKNDEIVRLLSEPGLPPTLNTGNFGQPIYEATDDTPRYRVEITNAGEQEWGDNVLVHTDVPIPEDAVPSTGSDGKLVVIDRENDRVVDLWRAARTPTGWSAEWGGIYPLDGTGSSTASAYGEGRFHKTWPEPLSRGTGSGISSLAGVLRAEDLATGVIDHPLVFSTDRACGPAQTGDYRWPATTTDGWVADGPCIPQGARVQLDPSIDLTTIPGITKVELMVGKALQEYGAYCVDIGGARMALITEVAKTQAEKDTYSRLFSELGVDHPDYQALRRLPIDKARVLARWDGR